VLTAVKEVLYALGDDDLLLGHRDAEWTGLGPILEEDIAFSSMAQDEMGHAAVWYGLLGDLGEPDPDTIAFGRAPEAWRSARLFELPRGDYAFSLVRQFLADMADAMRLDALCASTVPAVAAAAARIRQEEKYHILHGRTYIERLSHGTDESRERIQAAVDEVFPYALGMWEPTAGLSLCVDAGIAPDPEDLGARWLEAVSSFLHDCGLHVPDSVEPVLGGRLGHHGEDLDQILDAMQRLHRLDPGATW
jgi:ring-1,2-phenylacetyl-CoA epoxidase subunit PaaC